MRARRGWHSSRRKHPLGGFIIQHRQTNLFHVVRALKTPRGLPCCLNRWQKQSDQDADNGDHHEQFDESKSAAA